MSKDDVKNDDGDGYVTEESEGDFVDVTEMKNWQDSGKVITPKKMENNSSQPHSKHLDVQRSQTMRSSMKSPLSRTNEESGVRTKRTISFNIQSTTKPQVIDIEPAKDERLRHLFVGSRWSSSSSDPETPQKSSNNIDNSPTKTVTSRDGDVIIVEIVDDKSPGVPGHVKWKSKSLGTKHRNRIPSDAAVKRRHSINEVTGRPNQPAVLRDSAIDLISDDEHSEAYTAVSLAGTLKRNTPQIRSNGRRRRYIVIGAVVLTAIAITIIVVLSVLLARK